MSLKNSSRITESSSQYNDLEKMSVIEILQSINHEDQTVAKTVKEAIPQIGILVPKIVERMKIGGRLFYIGAGTSGRLGIVDASECPPTFGVDHGLVIGIIAGGDTAIRKAVEFAEDSEEQGWKDLMSHNINTMDTVIGIAASGTTPYVIGALKKARENGNLTACICNNENSPLGKEVDFPIEVVVGPEFVTGSTRMKSGTAQKLILNMISTSIMISLGRVKGNKMVDMQLSNNKLVDRGIQMIMDELKIDKNEAETLLKKHGNVRSAINNYLK
jgi:N-acetylmuramic acid 6-phosphate etherase